MKYEFGMIWNPFALFVVLLSARARVCVYACCCCSVLFPFV